MQKRKLKKNGKLRRKRKEMKDVERDAGEKHKIKATKKN